MIARRMPAFQPEIVDGFIASSNRMTGLPEFLGIRVTNIEPGRLTAEMTVDPRLLTSFGNMHGGVHSALCDHVLGCVCYPHMEKGQWAATTEFKINLLAPVSTGAVRAHAEILSMSKQTAVVRIEMENEGRLCGSAQGTVLIQNPRPKG
ncbi:MAG: PaaI family thioesterase [Phenylobacterium sp.]|uniref:PaaI family thioesterase n=1 Tax=Phenylobacterium sp. TaxID=1871053 RepID=UPI0011FF8853|nr:PaaI family thioesterase [Phenylobacterium sp.]TAL28178.1 MAG: PaaI family thioesterase [Phenylobacterium sp.]